MTTTSSATVRFVRAALMLTIAALAIVALVAPPMASAAPAKPSAITVTSVVATKNDAKLDVYRVSFSNGTSADIMRSLGSALGGESVPFVGATSGWTDSRWYIPLTTTRGGGDVRWTQRFGTGKKAHAVAFVGY